MNGEVKRTFSQRTILGMKSQYFMLAYTHVFSHSTSIINIDCVPRSSSSDYQKQKFSPCPPHFLLLPKRKKKGKGDEFQKPEGDKEYVCLTQKQAILAIYIHGTWSVVHRPVALVTPRSPFGPLEAKTAF